jgi:sec-independent protein translocase protein TatB
MFDIGFSELMVIAVVALVVLGPERLPRVARTMGHLFGRLQRYVNDVKADINREIELEELHKFKDEFQQAAQSVESDIKSEMHKAEASLAGVAADASLKSEIEKTDAEIRAIAEEAARLADPHATPAGPPATAEPPAAPAEAWESAPGSDSGTSPAAPGADRKAQGAA